MFRYADLRARAAEFVAKFSAGGPVLVLAPISALPLTTRIWPEPSAFSGINPKKGWTVYENETLSGRNTQCPSPVINSPPSAQTGT